MMKKGSFKKMIANVAAVAAFFAFMNLQGVFAKEASSEVGISAPQSSSVQSASSTSTPSVLSESIPVTSSSTNSYMAPVASISSTSSSASVSGEASSTESAIVPTSQNMPESGKIESEATQDVAVQEEPQTVNLLLAEQRPAKDVAELMQELGLIPPTILTDFKITNLADNPITTPVAVGADIKTVFEFKIEELGYPFNSAA